MTFKYMTIEQLNEKLDRLRKRKNQLEKEMEKERLDGDLTMLFRIADVMFEVEVEIYRKKSENKNNMETEQIRECVKRSIEEDALVERMMVIAQLKKLFTENSIELTKENFDIALSVAEVSTRLSESIGDGLKLYATSITEVKNKEHVIDVLKRHAQIKDIAYEI